MALSVGTQEATYLRGLMKDFGYEDKEPTIIYQDNIGSIEIANNKVVNRRTKHIDIRYHFI